MESPGARDAGLLLEQKSQVLALKDEITQLWQRAVPDVKGSHDQGNDVAISKPWFSSIPRCTFPDS
jgi:hypothetical protein